MCSCCSANPSCSKPQKNDCAKGSKNGGSLTPFPHHSRKQIDPNQFWQVHRGTVVNAKQIVSAHHDLLGKVTLSLKDRAEKVAGSRSYAHLFKQRRIQL
jgi:hypothetical protein